MLSLGEVPYVAMWLHYFLKLRLHVGLAAQIHPAYLCLVNGIEISEQGCVATYIYVKLDIRILNNLCTYRLLQRKYAIPYSRKFSRTINFAVFVDFIPTSKINPHLTEG